MISSQPRGSDMRIEINKKATINVSAEQLWKILADEFSTVGEWASGVTSSAASDAPAPDGAAVGGRVCQVPGFGEVDETFTNFDAAGHTFAFAATASKLPSFVTNFTNQTTVASLGPDKAQLEINLTADANGIRGALAKPVMTRNFSKAVDGVIEDLKVYATTGKVSGDKTRALAKVGR
jgi:hypothetical protein